MQGTVPHPNFNFSPKCTKPEAVLTLPCEFSDQSFHSLVIKKELKIHFQAQSAVCIQAHQEGGRGEQGLFPRGPRTFRRPHEALTLLPF